MVTFYLLSLSISPPCFSFLPLLALSNGGPVYYNGSAGANNYPLRGSKGANFEGEHFFLELQSGIAYGSHHSIRSSAPGGVRVNALVSGGAIPPAQRGTIRTGLICGWDWYATLAYLAGVDPTDHAAAAAGLPAVDGINVWNYLIGEVGE